MCGRFALTLDPAELQDAFPEFTFPSNFKPRYNIAPSQPVLVIPNDGSGKADIYIWGLIPSWAKDPSIGNRMINARAETLAEKPSFRGPLKYHRCLIPADGFFEWQAGAASKSKIPHLIRMKSGKPFAFAGLWEDWHAPDGSNIKSCTIITTQPNEMMAPIHNRMPVILPPDAYAQWLESNPQQAADMLPLLQPYPADEMIAHPVSTLVNSPFNDKPEILIPVEP